MKSTKKSRGGRLRRNRHSQNAFVGIVTRSFSAPLSQDPVENPFCFRSEYKRKEGLGFNLESQDPVENPMCFRSEYKRKEGLGFNLENNY